MDGRREAPEGGGRLLSRRRRERSNPAELVPPPGRQGPGPIPAALIEALDLAFVRRSGGVLAGEHRALGVGSGTELAQLRAYQPGDDVRQLDPAATARTGIPHVRQQVPERLLTTWIALDLSPSMAFGTADRLKCDVAEGVADVLGSLAIKRGGKVGLMTFGAPARRLIAPHGGRGALVQLRRALAEGVAPDDSEGEPLAQTAVRLGRLARQPGLMIVISDFGGDPSGWARPLAALGARHSLLAVEVRDPRELELPAVGRLALVDPETGERVEVDTSSRDLRRRYRSARAEERDEVARLLRRAGAEHVVVSTQGSWSKALGRRLA
jgi:uncharacterized protein (DUF58 family)